MGEGEEAVRCSLSTHELCNPEEKETTLSLIMWLPLAIGSVSHCAQLLHQPRVGTTFVHLF